jgi:hypothetical protein
MMVVQLSSRAKYWESSPAFSASMFTDLGTARQFEELLSVLSLPERWSTHL